jgi:hypothetical protein
MLDLLQRILYALVLDLILFDFRAALRCNAESSVWGEKEIRLSKNLSSNCPECTEVLWLAAILKYLDGDFHCEVS